MIEEKTSENRSSTLLTLCILTIIGNFLIMVKGLISYSVLIDSIGSRGVLLMNVIYLLEFISCLGAIVGAILMLSNQKMGLRIYQISSILYILITGTFAIFAIFSIVGIPVGLLQIVYLVPSILFFVLFQTNSEELN